MPFLSELQHRLRALKMEDRSQPGRHFVPKALLTKTFSPKDIARALAQPPFNIPLHRQEDACDIVFRGGLASFAIVVDAGLCHGLDRLIEENLLDDRLPFSQAEAGLIFGADAKIFVATQWTFLPHELRSHGYHRRLCEGTVLPYTHVQPFGGGRCSKVYKVKIHASCHSLARTPEERDAVFIRKEIDPVGLTEPGKAEAGLLYYLRALRHENIVELLTSYSLNGVSNLIFRCADCDLSDLLKQPRPPSLQHNHEILKALHGLSSGLRHLHDYRLIPRNGFDGSPLSFQGCHHDLKPKNVLVQGNTFILSDFGLSRLKDMEQDSKTPWQNAAFEYGAPECRNPETFQVGKVGRASDVWSLGCIMLEVLTYMRGGLEEVKSFKQQRRFEGQNAIAYAYHHDGATSPAVVSQVEMLTRPAERPQDAICIPFLPDLFSLQALDRPEVSVVESRLASSAIQTVLTTLLTAAEERFVYSKSSRSSANVFHAQMSLEIWRLKSWAAAAGWMPTVDGVLEETTNMEDAQTQLNVSEVYKLLNEVTTSLRLNRLNDPAHVTALNHHGSEDDTLSELHQLNNRLHNRLSESGSAKADQFFLTMIRSVDDDDVLSAISTEAQFHAPSDQKSIGLLAAMRYMASLMLSSSKFSARMDSALLSPDTINPPDPSTGPRLSWYHFDHQRKQKVHVERIQYGRKWLVDPNSEEFRQVGEKLFERIDRLSAFLRDVKKPAELRSLDCIGAYHSAEKKHFGFVYGIPNQDEHLITLRKLLDWRRSRHPPPNVDEKYSLAYALAATVNCVHLAGWVHKSLNPLNVVFSHHSRTDFKGVKYTEPFVIGFDYSRPEGVDQYTEGPDENMRAEYQHPAYRSDSEAFKTSFDYYALGLMLLEIGMWAPLSHIYDLRKEASPDALRGVYQGYCDSQLLKSMTKRYANTAKECLQMTGKDVCKEEMVFQTKVLPVLRDLAM